MLCKQVRKYVTKSHQLNKEKMQSEMAPVVKQMSSCPKWKPAFQLHNRRDPIA